MKLILITGSTGMVGRALVKILKKNYNILTPSSKILDLKNENKVLNYLKKKKPTHIVHLAGYIGGISSNINEPLKYLQDNLIMGMNLINAANKLKIQNLINMGSSCIYPPNQKKANKEDKLLNGKLEKTNEGYALAKITCVKLCEYISKNSSLNYISLIPCNIYGPYDKFDPIKSHVVGGLINKIYHAKKNKQEIVEIWGDGKSKREFIFVDDVARAIKKFMFSKVLKSKSIYWLNIGSGKDFTIKEITSKIAKNFNYTGLFKFNKKKPSGAKNKLLNIKLSKQLKFEIKINFNEGIKKTTKWYKDNYKLLL